MLWMKCLLLFGALFDVCMTQTNVLDTDSSLALWYKFDTGNPNQNSGLLGSVANFPLPNLATTEYSRLGDASCTIPSVKTWTGSFDRVSASSLTFSFWMYMQASMPKTDYNTRHILWFGVNGWDAITFRLSFDDTGHAYIQLYFAEQISGNWQQIFVYTDFNLRELDGSWVHIALDISPSAVLAYYVNGQSKYVGGTLYSQIGSILRSAMSSTQVYIGNTASDGLGWKNLARIDDLRLYTRKLSGTEILSLYNQPAPLPCGLGYTGPVGTCTACAAGFYKTVTGSAACTSCGNGTSGPTASTSYSSCVFPCPAGSTGPLGSCTLCVPGQYKTVTGSGACTNCPGGQYTAISGSTNCSNCSANTYSPVSGASTSNLCVPCTAYSTSPVGSSSSSACQDVTLLLWYPFELPNPTQNLGSAGSLSMTASPAQDPFLTSTNAARGNSSHIMSYNQYQTSDFSQGSTQITCSFWFYIPSDLNTVQGSLYLLTLQSTTGSISITLYMDQLQFTFYNGGSYTATKTMDFILGTVDNWWTQYAFDLSATTFSFYVNGTLQHSSTVNVPIFFNNPSYAWNLQLGHSGNTASDYNMRWKQSLIDDFRLYRRKLSTNEISTLAGKCTTGFTGPDDGVCSACVAGKYKSQIGSAGCSNCSVGTYSLTVGSIAVENCVACPVNSYSDTVGATACTACGGNGVSPAGSTAFAACQFECNAGSTGLPGACALCVAGKYKTSAGSAACTDCAEGTWSGATGATGASDCTLCGAGGVSPAGSTTFAACQFDCAAGSTGPPGACALCVAGKYKTSAGSAVCSDCGAGTYSVNIGATASAACVGCPVNSYSVAVGASVLGTCTCNIGYTGPDGGVCSACLAGSFKAQTGSAACVVCPNNTYADTGVNSSCVPCQANAVSASGSASQASCYCKIGYAHVAGVSTCRECNPGTYNSQLGRTACSNCSVGLYSVNYGAIGSETCLPCPLGQWSPEGSPNCNVCPTNSRAGAGSGLLTSCVCDAGYSGAAGSTCMACAAGTYIAAGSTACSACPALTSSAGAAKSASECWCVAGYIQVSGACVAMPPRAVVVLGSLTGVSANSNASALENATQAVRASVAALLGVPAELVRVERGNATDVRVTIFGRSESEALLIENKIRLATAAATVSQLPFTLRTGAYTNTSVLAAPRAVVLACRLLNLTAPVGRRLLASTDVVADALAVLRLDLSRRFNVSVAAVRLSFDALSAGNTLPLTVTVDARSAEELQTLRGVASALQAAGSVVFANAMVLLVYSTQDAGPSGLNFTSTLERAADGVRMTAAELRAGTVLATLQAQVGVYYGVPASAVEVTVVVSNGVDSVQTVVRAVAPATVASLQARFAQASPTLYVAAVVLELAFRMTNVAVSYASVPTASGVSMPNAVSIVADLVNAAGAALSGGEVAAVTDALTWQMSRFFGVDASLVVAEGAPGSASGVRVVVLSGAAAADDVLLRAEQLAAAPTALVREASTGIAGLSSAVMTVLQGQMVAGQFVECPTNYRVYNNTCQCAPGYMLLPDLSTCAACAAGTYGVSAGATACAACPANTFSTGASTACSACQANAVSADGSASADACLCIAGYSSAVALGKRVCLSCAAGSYKNGAGNFNCSVCSLSKMENQVCCPLQSTMTLIPSAFSALYMRSPPKFHYTGSSWDNTTKRFLDVSGNGRHSLGLDDFVGDGYCNTYYPEGSSVPRYPAAAVEATGFVQTSISGVAPYPSVSVPAVACPNGQCMLSLYRQSGCVGATNYKAGGYASDYEYRTLDKTKGWTMCTAARVVQGGEGGPGLYQAAGTQMLGWGGGNGGVGFYSNSGGYFMNFVARDLSQWTVVCVKSTPGLTSTNQVMVNGVGMANLAHSAPFSVDVQIGDASGSYGVQNRWYIAQILVWDSALADTDMKIASDQLLAHVQQGANMPAGCGTAGGVFCAENSCLCKPGYSGPANGLCGACAVGMYKNTTSADACAECAGGSFAAANGSTGCAPCPANTFAGAGAQSCTVCPNFTQSAAGSNASSACACVPGYTGPGGLVACTACAAGSFKSAAGSAACAACPARTYSSAVGAASNATCTACHPNATSAAGSPAQGYCYCEAGFAQVNGTTWCALCNPGKYNTQLARTACSNCTVGLYAAGYGSKGLDSCFSCPAGQWSPEGSPDCKMCPVNTAAPARSGSIINCLCNVGLTGPDGGPCVACVAGKFKNSSGTANCTSCAFGSDSVSGQAACTCTERFFASGGGCAPKDATYLTVISPVVDLLRSCGVSQTERCITLRSRGYGGSGVSGRLKEFNDGNYDSRDQTDCRDSITGHFCTPIDLEQERLVKEVVLWFKEDVYWSGWWKDDNYIVRVGNTNIAYVDGQAFNPSSLNTPLCNATLASTANLAITIPGYGNLRKVTISCSNTVRGQYFTLNSYPTAVYQVQYVELQAFGYLNPEGSETYYACNSGYTGPAGGPCTACGVGTYKDTPSIAACTACPANSSSSSTSTNVTACVCNARYTGPNGGPCVACAAGTAKNSSGSAACGVCPADTFSNVSAASVCTACPTGYKALSGTTTSVDCCGLNSSPQAVLPPYSTTVRTRFIALTPKPSFASISTRTNAPIGTLPTYNAAGGPNGKGHVSFARANSQYLDAGPRTFNVVTNGGLTIAAVARFTGSTATWERLLHFGSFQNVGTDNVLIARNGDSTSLQVEVFSGNTRTIAVSIADVIQQNSWFTVVVRVNAATRGYWISINGVSATSGTASLPLVDTMLLENWIGRSHFGSEPFLNADIAGLFVVDEFLDTDAATSITNAMLQGVDFTSIETLCSCNAGYTGADSGASKGQCTTCPAGTYKSTNGSAACSLCPANTLSTAVQATSNGTCVACPMNSVAVSGSTLCLCDAGYTGAMASCAACAAGTFKGAPGPSACTPCPANTETVGPAAKFCTSVAGFSGLGYALADVARSCGVGLNETCATLANGATTNAVGAVDGALDANPNTFVSVAFNPNLARSSGKSGTDACAASISPVFSGASVVNGAANDGDTNTQAGSDYEFARTPYIRPYWGVDFGQTKSVFAVKILTTSLAWQYLKDFKIVVGNVADAQSPLNAVCADYLTGAGTSYATFACEDTVRGRYLYIVNGPHAQNYLTLSEVVVESFNYTANPALMQPWWAVDFAAERAVASVVLQTQAAGTVQVRVGASTDPLQNAVCASGALAVGVNNTITCATAMAGRYVFVVGAANSVLVLNEIRVAGAAAAQCAAGSYKLGGNTACTACPAFSTSVAGATVVAQCSCSAPYF